jgi:hypothetical protein
VKLTSTRDDSTFPLKRRDNSVACLAELQASLDLDAWLLWNVEQ